MDYYKQIFDSIPENRKAIALKLIEDAKYIDLKLIKYKEIIDEDGLIVEMPQGTYTIEREHPAIKGFHAMIKSRDTMISRLENMAGDRKFMEAEKAGETLKAFISKGKK